MAEFEFVGICGSLRKESRNMGLLRKARELMPAGSSLTIADISCIPFYNEDIATPDSVSALAELGDRAAGWIFACPEYNYSLAPALKNAIDWLSREPGLKPFYGKPGAIMGAGGGMGTSRSQNHMRQVCVYLNLHLVEKPEFFSNAFSGAFNAEGDLVDDGLVKQLGELMQALFDWAKVLRTGAA